MYKYTTITTCTNKQNKDVVSWFSQKQNQFLLRSQAFAWSLSRLLLVWGKCFPNIVITKMLYGKMCVTFWTPIFIICIFNFGLWQGYHYCQQYMIWKYDWFSPKEVVSRCYCQHCGWCYTHIYIAMADIIAIIPNVMVLLTYLLTYYIITKQNEKYPCSEQRYFINIKNSKIFPLFPPAVKVKK